MREYRKDRSPNTFLRWHGRLVCRRHSRFYSEKIDTCHKARNGLSKVRKCDHTGLALRRKYIRVIRDQGVLVGINAQ